MRFSEQNNVHFIPCTTFLSYVVCTPAEDMNIWKAYVTGMESLHVCTSVYNKTECVFEEEGMVVNSNGFYSRTLCMKCLF